MLLNIEKTNIDDRFSEFDLWITAKLTEIKDTDKYASELKEIMMWLDVIANHTDNFDVSKKLTAEVLTQAILDKINDFSDPKEIESNIVSAASLLFLVTGKSDNNCKCQFPIFLRDKIRVDSIPKVKKKNGQLTLSTTSIPREIKSTRVAKLISELNSFKDPQKLFLEEYISFILDEPEFLNSFWSIGKSYISMKEFNLHEEFLMPLVVFKIRGSVSASGGHDPENILRELMTSWGLEAEIDFNTTDVVVGKEGTGRKVKTRAYDFVLPYNLENWESQIFIQCQFYAGDSGSVSHKNVDQTRTSRDYTKTKFNNPIFIEFLDGAGYFSSLNGDLKTLLSMEDTNDFFQLRTAAFKLRRALQDIGFLTPLDLVHSLFANDYSLNNSINQLLIDGYTREEILRVVEKAKRLGIIVVNDKEYCSVDSKFEKNAISYFLYDQLLLKSSTLNRQDITGGVILVPGANQIQGIKLSDIPKLIIEKSGSLRDYLGQSANLLSEIEILAEKQFIMNL
ncbi:hypothetical protein [Tenacibaculum aiptasiae]|uniref:hypothetical protein n=1 Tax=Tenacibaculum aiptasiae TaxID=426481 RepID=UPI00232FE30C|nr:hypothetical protein [Tenacibaculum aiptasiae]